MSCLLNCAKATEIERGQLGPLFETAAKRSAHSGWSNTVEKYTMQHHTEEKYTVEQHTVYEYTVQQHSGEIHNAASH